MEVATANENPNVLISNQSSKVMKMLKPEANSPHVRFDETKVIGGVGTENSILNTSDSEEQRLLTQEQPSAIDILKDKMKVKKSRNLIDALQSAFK